MKDTNDRNRIIQKGVTDKDQSQLCSTLIIKSQKSSNFLILFAFIQTILHGCLNSVPTYFLISLVVNL